jgi:hypothetical protein
MEKILYDFDDNTKTFDKLKYNLLFLIIFLSKLEESFNKIPTVIIRNVALIPENLNDKKHKEDEE